MLLLSLWDGKAGLEAGDVEWTVASRDARIVMAPGESAFQMSSQCFSASAVVIIDCVRVAII